MDRNAVVKRFITDTKNWLIACGAEFQKKSENSNSVYLSAGSTKIRVSDHIVVVSEHTLNIVFSSNKPGEAIVIYNNAVMTYCSFKDLKSFLKCFCDISICTEFSYEGKLNTRILEKQAKVNKLNEELKEKTKKVDAMEADLKKNSSALTKCLDNLKYIKASKTTDKMDISHLTEKQKKQVLVLVNSFTEFNESKK